MEQRNLPQDILFTSLGTTVLDEIYVDGKLTAQNSPGGAAIFSTLGARLFARAGKHVALRIVAGEDFPVKVEEALRRWDIALDLQRSPGVASTRAELRYGDAMLETREFQYLTPVLQPKPKDLRDTPILASEVFHLLSTPQEVVSGVNDLVQLRHAHNLYRPLIIWEPRPTSCIFANFLALHEAIKFVDVFSPNHLELLALFDEPASSTQFNKTQIETLAQYLVDSGVGFDADGIVLIRCANHGALILSRTIPAAWVPAYWTLPSSTDAHDADDTSARHPSVVDTTGAGNCYLGGFAMGLLETGDPIKAASYGAVSSSFVVQQLGLPVLTTGTGKTNEAQSGQTEDVEKWNGESVRDRLEVQLRKADGESESR